MAKNSAGSMRSWALRGAQQRLVELQQEMAEIRNAFPELRQKRSSPGAESVGLERSGPARAPATRTGRRRRRALSAEARKRISDAQKARWAKQKAKKG
jgi:hypothetical protein